MATTDEDLHLVTTDPMLAAELMRLWENELDTPTLTEHVRSLGLTPPDGRDGWSIGYAYGSDGEDLGLVWSEPSYPED